MPSGGPRQGAPGQAYGNRTDLNTNKSQAVTTVPGQAYGKAKEQADAQGVVPLPQQAGPVAGGFGSLVRPSERPEEPVTSGVPRGPGPGPEALSFAPGTDDTSAQLRALYLAYPNPDMLDLVESLDER